VTPNSSKRFWAKGIFPPKMSLKIGTGYGTNNDASSDWNHSDYMKEQQNKAKQSQCILQILSFFLTETDISLPEGLFEVWFGIIPGSKNRFWKDLVWLQFWRVF
jgi:hypothetical protein